MWIREVVSAFLKLTLETFKGSFIPPISNALESPPPQNDDPFLVRLTQRDSVRMKVSATAECDVRAAKGSPLGEGRSRGNDTPQEINFFISLSVNSLGP